MARCYEGLKPEYLAEVLQMPLPLSREIYEERIWWWRTINHGELIGDGNAESGMSLAELESYSDTIFRYELFARINGRYPHGKPWPWIRFDDKFDEVSRTGEIDHEFFDYRDFVDGSGRESLEAEPPRDGWSRPVSFWFRLDAPENQIVDEVKKLLNRERERHGIKPRKRGRPRDATPWEVLERMDQGTNPTIKTSGGANDPDGSIPRVVKRFT